MVYTDFNKNFNLNNLRSLAYGKGVEINSLTLDRPNSNAEINLRGEASDTSVSSFYGENVISGDWAFNVPIRDI